MPLQIYPIHLGINRCYIVRDKGVIMIDGGPPNRIKTIKKFLADMPMLPGEIKLIVLSHGDFDHVGSAADIRELSGAKIAIHEKDRINLEQARFNFPRGVTAWGHITRGLLLPFLKPLVRFQPARADIVLNEKDFSLEQFGINGKIIHTPGHTPGSVSVLLETGEAFVGCLAHSNLPFRLKPGLPIFAGDIERVIQSWKSIIERGARMIYPAHGDPFPVEVIKNILKI